MRVNEPVSFTICIKCKRMDISTSYIDMLSNLRAGNLKSPVVVDDNAYIKIRITGTGITERYEFDENNNLIYENGKPKTYQIDRQKEVFLSDAFLKSCIGIPVLLNHPKDDVLTSNNFNEHVVGTIVDSYINGNEVWGIARIYDKNILPILKTELKSTSPCVISENKNSGNGIIKEEDPLIDHIALVSEGYWDAYSNRAMYIDNFIKIEPNKEGTMSEEIKKDNEELNKADNVETEALETQKIEQIKTLVEDIHGMLMSKEIPQKEEVKTDNDDNTVAEEEVIQDNQLDNVIEKLQGLIGIISASNTKDVESKEEAKEEEVKEVIEEKVEEEMKVDEEDTTIEDEEEKVKYVDAMYNLAKKHKDNGFNYVKALHNDSKYSYIDRVIKKNASLVEDKYKFLTNGVNKGNYAIACDCLKSIEKSLEMKAQSKKVDNKSSINVVYDDGKVKRYTGIF